MLYLGKPQDRTGLGIADFIWVLYEKQNVKETKSEDKLDADNHVYKRTKETARKLEPY